ncbi:MAG: tetratricopeptide repeat protein, partial [Bacteroidales bacterium]|nr:tetratricopeptide repeat protein [Bacteroidales bacterium]
MRKLIVLFLLIINGFLGFSQELDSLIKDLDNLSGEKKVKQLNKITWKLRNSDPRTAIIYNSSAITLADRESFNYELTKAYNFAGVLYRNLGVYAQALESYQIAVDLALKYGVDDQLGYAYNNFGNLYLYQESPLLAKQYLFLVLPIAEKLKNDDLLAYAYQNLGRSYLLLGKNDSARIL